MSIVPDMSSSSLPFRATSFNPDRLPAPDARTPNALSASNRLRLACDARFSQRFEMAEHAANIRLEAREQRECANGLEDRHPASIRHATSALAGGLQ